jgi:hypothetical protein
MARKRTILRRIVFTALTLCVLLAAAALFNYSLWPGPFETRFRRSRPALEAYAAQVMATDPASPVPQPPARLGAFQAGSAERLPHGFLLFCDYGHPLDANGIAYSTEPPPSNPDGRDHFKHIEGNWYTVWRN